MVVTNNFGEIKSSVFKKYPPPQLFSVVAADVVERMHLLSDAFIVSLKLATAASPKTVSPAAVCSLVVSQASSGDALNCAVLWRESHLEGMGFDC